MGGTSPGHGRACAPPVFGVFIAKLPLLAPPAPDPRRRSLLRLWLPSQLLKIIACLVRIISAVEIRSGGNCRHICCGVAEFCGDLRFFEGDADSTARPQLIRLTK
ncbi:hypothetical protein KSP40_PGU009170 [Platanthera guangdongensis]|uniref:Uncharacterized protein n=1 Tax=Platanthera guangdongensis TaxID=2320717 RepID=A0ABR2MJA4_9ASPA